MGRFMDAESIHKNGTIIVNPATASTAVTRILLSNFNRFVFLFLMLPPSVPGRLFPDGFRFWPVLFPVPARPIISS